MSAITIAFAGLLFQELGRPSPTFYAVLAFLGFPWGLPLLGLALERRRARPDEPGGRS